MKTSPRSSRARALSWGRAHAGTCPSADVIEFIVRNVFPGPHIKGRIRFPPRGFKRAAAAHHCVEYFIRARRTSFIRYVYINLYSNLRTRARVCVLLYAYRADRKWVCNDLKRGERRYGGVFSPRCVQYDVGFYRYGSRTGGPSTENRKSNCKRHWPRPPCYPDATGPPWWETSTPRRPERTRDTRIRTPWTDTIRR